MGMRVLLVAAISLLLAGCTDALPGQFVVDTETPEDAPIDPREKAPNSYPARFLDIPLVAYTAPDAIAVDSEAAHGFTVSLIADDDGLTCRSESSKDPTAAPPGYSIVSSKLECWLDADDELYVFTSAPHAISSLLMTPGVPVDSFTWGAQVTRTLVNNSGEMVDILVSVDRPQSASPAVQEMGEFLWVVCANEPFSPLGQGPQSLYLEAFGHNGRAELTVDASQFDVLDWDSWGAASAVIEDGLFVLQSEWSHEPYVALELLIEFHVDNGQLAYSPECNGATWGELQHLETSALVTGIAAGWESFDDTVVDIAVYSTMPN